MRPPANRRDAAPQGDDSADWLSAPEPPALGNAIRDKTLLDALPVGVLIYRLDRLLYANRAFLDRIGYASLQTLEEADGLDALFVERSNTAAARRERHAGHHRRHAGVDGSRAAAARPRRGSTAFHGT